MRAAQPKLVKHHPVFSTLGRLNVGTVNGGSFLSRLPYFVSLINRFKLDVLFVAETRLTNNIAAAAACAKLDLHFISALRPADGGRPGCPVGGGVAFLAPRRPVRITKESEDRNGGLSVLVQKHGLEPIAITGVYLPPRASRYSKQRSGLLTWQRLENDRLRKKWAHCSIPAIHMGDFNAQLGDGRALKKGARRWLRRHTVAHMPDTPSAIADSIELQEHFATMGMAPLHGRSKAKPGQTTCGNANGKGRRTEIDFLLAPSLLHTSQYDARSTHSWLDVPSAHVHRLVHASLFLQRSGATPRQPPTARKTPAEVPEYGNSKAWGEVARTLEESLARARPTILDPRTSHKRALRALREVLMTATVRHLHRPQACVRTGAFRRMDNMSVPPDVARRLEQARQLRRRAGRMHRAATSSAEHGAADEVHLEARRIQRAALVDGQRVVRQWTRQRARDLEMLRSRDPRAMATLVGRRGAVLDPILYGGRASAAIPDKDGITAGQRFGKFWKELLAEARPAPKGAVSRWWMQFVPRASRARETTSLLTDIFTQEEVARIIYPPDMHATPKPCHADCPVCREYAKDHANWATGQTIVPPAWSPVMHMGKSLGTFGVPAEVIRFARHEDLAARAYQRAAMAKAVASVLTKCLQQGGIDADEAETIISPIIKSAKPGQPTPDTADPDSYRGIALMNTIAKILAAALTARLAHWAIINKILHESQVGFLYRHSAEMHVFTATQAIRSRLRNGERTFGLFVDLRKAYDCVHLDSLWKVLRHMGVPDTFIALLSAWAKVRKGRVKINGAIYGDESFVIDKGVPQGDPLSPLLYNLYQESLSRMLEHASSKLEGIVASGVHIRKLLYCDDLSIFCHTVEQLQHALNLVDKWCKAWGMGVSVGAGKTEAICFDPKLTEAECTDLPPLRVSGGEIEWVTQYRFLGYMMRWDLSDETDTASLIDRLNANYHKYFERNSIVRKASVALQLQNFKTYVVGAINYLRSTVLLSVELRKKINVSIMRWARSIVGLPARNSVSTELTLALSRIVDIDGICARETERFRLQLVNTPFTDCLARRMYLALITEPVTTLSRRGNLANWAHAVEAMRRTELARGAVESPPISHADSARAAHVWARSIAYNASRRRMHAAYPPPADDANLIILPPPSHGSKRHVASLYMHMKPTAAELGTRAGCTPLSVGGPGCSASLVAIARTGQYRAVVRAQLGAEALLDWPFTRWREQGQASGHEQGVSKLSCKLCGSESVTLYHLAIECRHREMVAMRRSMWTGIQELTMATWEAGVAIVECRGKPTYRTLDARGWRPPKKATLHLSEALGESSFQESEGGKFLAYWTLLATPWGRRACAAAARRNESFNGPPTLMGELFDALTVRQGVLRELAARWLTWSNGHIHKIARIWQQSTEMRLRTPQTIPMPPVAAVTCPGRKPWTGSGVPELL